MLPVYKTDLNDGRSTCPDVREGGAIVIGRNVDPIVTQ